MAVSVPGDAAEREASSAAERVLRTPAGGTPPPPAAPADAPSPPPPLTPAPGPAGAGRPLEPGVREYFELRFGRDLSPVRVHADAQAAEAARAVDALAFTAGRDVVFGEGCYAPGTGEGRRLLAHELAHVVQPGSGDGARVLRQPAESAKTKLAAGQLVVARIAFALMDRPGGEPGQKKVKQVAKGDMLRVESDASGGSGLAYRLTVMKSREEAETGTDGQPLAGVASFAWLSPAPAAPADEKPSGDTGQTKQEGPAQSSAAAAAAAQAKRREEIQAIAAGDVRSQWAARKADFLAVAADPANTLGGLQMYQIWLRFWMDRQHAGHEEVRALDDRLRAQDLAGYVPRKMDFDKGKRSALGPEYEAAADRRDTADYVSSELKEVHDWLENWIDGTGHHVTLQRVNEKAVEIVRAKAWYRLFMEAIILGAVGMAEAARGAPAGGGKAPVPAEEPPPGRSAAAKGEQAKGEGEGKGTGEGKGPGEGKSAEEGKGADEPRPAATAAPQPTPLQQLARDLVRKLVAAGKRVVVNIGGAGARHEPADAINVNNQAVGRKGIPNLVQADGSAIGELFEPGSVDSIVGYNMAGEAVDWSRAAKGAYRVLKPGGTIDYGYRGQTADAEAAAAHLRAAGFVDVKVKHGAGFEAKKP